MKKARCMAFSINKGGNLKTTSTVSLGGAILKKEGKKKPISILIIDTDMQGNVCTSFNVDADEKTPNLRDVLFEGCKAEDAIFTIYENEKGHIDVLPSNDDCSLIEIDLVEQYKNPLFRLRETCGHLVNEYDYILFDTPPAYSLMVGNVLCFDAAPLELYLPFQPERYAYRSLRKAVDLYNMMKSQYNEKLTFKGVFAVLVDSRTALHSTMLQEARKYCLESEITMLETTIRKSIRGANAIAYQGLPATLVEDKRDFVNDYFELWEEMKND